MQGRAFSYTYVLVRHKTVTSSTALYTYRCIEDKDKEEEEEIQMEDLGGLRNEEETKVSEGKLTSSPTLALFL